MQAVGHGWGVMQRYAGREAPTGRGLFGRSVPMAPLVLVVLATRLVVARLTADVPIALDEVDYLTRATFLLEHHHLPDAFRPPVYPIFLALILSFPGADVPDVRLVQALLGTLGCLAGWAAVRRLAGERAAVVTLLVLGLFPTLVGFTHMVLSENVFIALLSVLAFSLVLRGGWVGPPVLAGGSFALAVLTRSFLLGLFPVIALAVLIEPVAWRWRSRPGRRLAVFLVAFVATLVPWTVHNLQVEGAFVPLGTTSGYNLWKGNTPHAAPLATEGPRCPGPFVDIPMFPYEGHLEALAAECSARLGQPVAQVPFREMDRCARTLALDYIGDAPMAFLARGVRKVGYLLHPSSLVTFTLVSGGYGEVPPWAVWLFVWGTAATTIGLLGIGALRLIRMAMSPFWAFILCFLAWNFLVVFVSFGTNRFLVPVLWALALVAGVPGKGKVNQGSKPLRPGLAGAGPASAGVDS